MGSDEREFTRANLDIIEEAKSRLRKIFEETFIEDAVNRVGAKALPIDDEPYVEWDYGFYSPIESRLRMELVVNLLRFYMAGPGEEGIRAIPALDCQPISKWNSLVIESGYLVLADNVYSLGGDYIPVYWLFQVDESIDEKTRYRIDAVMNLLPAGEYPGTRADPVVRIAIELDGHDFHERTKKQAERDKKKDRDLQSAGYYVLRFTGSQVFNDAAGVLREIHQFAFKAYLEHITR